MSSENEMTDAQFANIFGITLGIMIVVAILLIIIAAIIGGGAHKSDLNAQAHDVNVSERIQPVGQVTIGAVDTEQTDAAAAAGPLSGEDVYGAACVACHGAGVAGAPAVGDAPAWTDRIAQGMDTLYEHAIVGFQGSAGMMPAKGGAANLSDDDVKAAVDYMVENSK